ncbi:hypothetical protein KUL106_00710 [Alteromonas sp. KUL106]|nr:hypothetical protein KUL106_00710 [Alteromonas sp. KUL106]
MQSISVFCAPDCSGVAVQHIPSYRVLFLPQKYESYVKAWKSSANFPALPKMSECDFGLTKDDIAELTDLLSQNNLID